MVECQLPKLKVAGSIPVSRSSNHKQKAAAQTLILALRPFDFANQTQRVKGTKAQRLVGNKFLSAFEPLYL
jgi:hypothetical protein